MTAARPGGSGRSRRADKVRLPDDDDDLRTGLAALSRLATGQMELEDVLTRVAGFAVSAIPGAEGVGLTLLESGQADTIVASAPFVAAVDAIQYGIGEGPCISAAAEARTVRSGELDSDPQWPRFGPQIAHLGVHSALSIPLLTSAGVLGAMNVYSHEPNSFDEHGARIGELFAEPAAIAVQNAQVLAQAKRLATQVAVALGRHAVIDQAIGIMMSRLGCDADTARARLGAESLLANEELHIAAGRLVDEAVQRGREGSTQP
jgi:GAF domain-containing protein